MKLLAPEQIGVNRLSHASALGWIARLFLRPKELEAMANSLSRLQRAAVALRIYFHAMPYSLLLAGAGRWFIFGVLGQSSIWPSGYHVQMLIAGLAGGVVAGLAVSYFGGLAAGIAACLIGSVAIGLVGGLAGGLVGGFVGGLAVGLAFGLAFGIAVHLAGGLFVGVAVGPGGSLFGGVAFGLASDQGLENGLGVVLGWLVGYFFTFLRLYYAPIYILGPWLYLQGEAYRFHPVAWDDVCVLPFPGLDRLLVAFTELEPETGICEIDRLIDDYPSQRDAALRSRAILVVRRAASIENLSRLDEIFVALPEGKRGFLAEIPDIRQSVNGISALQTRLDTLDRPFLREPFAALIVKEIEIFRQQIAGFTVPLSTELRKAARNWLEIAQRELKRVRSAAVREPTLQVFRAGDPVDRNREAFVPRGVLLGEIDRQVLLATGCPGLVIYGRRRMGKSTLLRNLEGFLTSRVRMARLSMQEARSFTSLSGLMDLLGRRITSAVEGRLKPMPSDLESLELFLNSTEERLASTRRRLLIAIDEYENLDRKIGEQVLPEDLLAVLRESIQSHRQIVWIFAGSMAVDELTNAPWTSYLVSARTLEVTPFEPEETRLLLTEPLRHSPLWRDAEALRPRFAPGFWGLGGIERIHASTGGWPHLVQLVAETVVDLVNDAEVDRVDEVLLERAFGRAVVRGNNVFLELLRKESRIPGEWDYLRAFRDVDDQIEPRDEAVSRSLKRRRLVVEVDGQWRLRAPLMSRWLREGI